MVSGPDPKFVIMEHTGHLFRRYREQLGYTQQQLAPLLLIRACTLSKIENGRQRPNAQVVVRAAMVFGCRPEKLLPAQA